jgi:apolipoprotein N-acyltransferase
MTVDGAAIVNGLSVRLSRLAGVKRAMAAILLGAILTASMPPLFVLPAAFIAFIGLTWLLDGVRAEKRPFRAALIVGWCFGFGHFTTGLYWIANALLVDAAHFGWLIPFAIGGLSAYFAVFPALAAAAYALAPGSRAARIVVFAGAWTLSEYLRSTLFTGFSWNLLGTVWTFAPVTMQGVAFIGTYGLGLASVLMFAAPAILNGSRRSTYIASILALIGFVPMVAGAVRFASAPSVGSDSVSGVKLALIQGNISQQMKWNPEERIRIIQTYLDLTSQAVKDGATHIVWPETAVPVALDRAADIRAAIAAILGSGNAKALIAGTVRLSEPDAKTFQAWNSVEAIDATGRVIDTYDKFHLVPFGEYLPLRGWLPIDKITPGSVDFSAGPGPETIEVPGLPLVGPLVCYEVIFPGEVAKRDPRPGMLLNVTNDAWFGDSAGPRQHFAAARLRAVEEGLPLIRNAGTGISAIVDPYGRVLERLDMEQRGIVEGDLPQALAPTPFSRFGNRLALGLAAFAIAIGVLSGRKHSISRA